MNEQCFPKDQHVSDLGFKDSFVALLESSFSDFLKISDFISRAFTGEYGFLKDSLSLLIYIFFYHLINDRDNIISVLKFLEWLLSKFSFT